MEASQRDQTHNQPYPLLQNHTTSPQDPDFFAFLRITEEKHARYPSFFSKNGLSQDIIQVTQAEPDICLEAFYALFNTLWPQIESQLDVSFKDAWKNFIGGSIIKGSLCPPEKLIIERKLKDIKSKMSEPEGESRIFQDLDEVVKSIGNLKQKIDDYSGEILSKKEIIESLSLVQEFYLNHRNKVKGLVQTIIDKEKSKAPYAPESDELEDLLEPKAVMMSDSFAHHWAYRISRSQAQRLLSLDASGRSLKSNSGDPSHHRVVALPENNDKPLVFFKANGNPPIQPEKDFMFYSLYQHLQIPALETALLVLTDVFETNPDDFYAVQASEAVIGESSLKAYQNPETTFNHEAYVSQTIGAFLTNPSDGSFKNFKYSPEYKTFISIDNDEVFNPELAGPDDKKIVNVRSILYLLPQIDLPIPESIKTFFTTLDPHLVIFAWIQDLLQKNKGYSLLFTKLAFQKTRCIYQSLLPRSQISSLSTYLQQKIQVDFELHNESFYPQILVSSNLLMHMTEKLQLIEEFLLDNCSASTQKLFEEILPLLGKYYHRLRFEFSDIGEALEALWGNKKNGIDYSSISSLLDYEEFCGLSGTQIENENLTPPEILSNEYKEILSSGQSALDRFVRRHSQRKKNNLMNLQVAWKELELLVQEGLTNSQSPRDIVDFSHILSKMDDCNTSLRKEITSLLSNLPHAELKWLFTLEKYFLRTEHSVPNNLMSTLTPVLGALMKQRTFILTELESQYLFDQEGNIKKNKNLTGRSSVTCFPERNPEFYLKQYPEWPGYEFASTLFMRLLGIQHLPYQDLIIINSKYPVLLTQKIIGKPVLRVWDDFKAFNNLDPVHTGLLIISAMLMNPEDGKEDNFMLSPDRKYIIPIDNDHCFLPSFSRKEGNFWNGFTVNTTLQAKTLLFCLNEMQMQVPPEVREHFLSLDFDELLIKWMAELNKIENKFNNLVDQNLQNKFLKQGTVMRLPFYKQFIHNLHWKVHRIQGILKATSNVTPFDLLKAVEPFAAKRYQDSFEQGSNLQSRFRAATNQLYKKTAIDGSRVSIINTRTMMELIHVSEEDLQTDIMFQRMGPVEALELLNQLIQEHNEKTQMEQEMLLELDETKQEKSWISLFGNPPEEAALKAFLENPKAGLILRGSRVITSNRLTDLFSQTPERGVKIRFLSLPECPLLTDKVIKLLVEECPNIEYLNVSGCLKLKQLVTREGEWPLLARLEAKSCLNLKNLVSFCPMKILRIETNSKIEVIVKKSTPDILTISSFRKKSEFSFSLKKMEEFELTSLKKTVSYHDVEKHILKKVTLDDFISKNLKITTEPYSISSMNDLAVFFPALNFQDSNIQVEDFKRFMMLNLRNLKSIGFPRMETDCLEFFIQRDLMKVNSLDLSWSLIGDKGVQILCKGNWPLLETLGLKGTEITMVGIKAIVNQTKWPQLKNLDLSNNLKITDEGFQILSQGNLPKLEVLNLSNLKITTVAIEAIVNQAKWLQLKTLNISPSKLDEQAFHILAQGNWPQLEELFLNPQGITKKVALSFLKTSWPKFKRLHFPQKQDNSHDDRNFIVGFIKKDFSPHKNLELKNLYLTFAHFEILINQTKLPSSLDLSDNDIFLEVDEMKIDLVKKSSELITLRLENTKLTSNSINFIASGITWYQLKFLDLSNNEIFDQGLSLMALGEWLFLEELHLKNTKITPCSIEILVSKMKLLNLKALNISENAIFDEGLKLIVSGNWPLFQSLFYTQTKVSPKGHIFLLENFKWPDLHFLEHSFTESFFHFNENSPSELIIAAIPSVFQNKGLRKSALITILNINWLNSKAIHLLIKSENGSWKKRAILQPHHTLQTELTKFSFEAAQELKPLQPRQINLKAIKFFSRDIFISKKSLEMLITAPGCLSFNTIDLSEKRIDNEGLRILISADCPFLEALVLRSTQITAEGFEILSTGNWPLLKTLNLNRTMITTPGLKAIVNQAKWSQLKDLNIAPNDNIDEEGFHILAQGNWPELESLGLDPQRITAKAISNFLLKANWPKLARFGFLTDHCNRDNATLLHSFIRKDLSKVEKLELDSLEQETLTDLKNIIDQCQFPKLKKLNLSNNFPLETTTVKTALAKCPELEKLFLENTKITIESIETIAIYKQLKCLSIAHNEVFDEGLSVLAFSEWPFLERLNLKNTKITPNGIETLVNKMKLPSLKALNVSENAIFNEGLEVLTAGNWPLFENLAIENVQITLKGIIFLLENFVWLNFNELGLSFNESFYNSSEVILATIPIYYKTAKNDQKQSLLVTVLDKTWLNAKEISVSISHYGSKDQTMILPCDRLAQLEHVELSFDALPKIKSLELLWPTNLKTLNFYPNQLSDPTKLGSFYLGKCLSLESVYLHNTKLSTRSLEILTSYWPNLRLIQLSGNIINNEMLQILVSANWKLLETLELKSTHLTDEGVEILVRKSKWPHLKCLLLYGNQIQDEGLKTLASSKWPLLETLDLRNLMITKEGIESMVKISEWPNLKILDLSFNVELFHERVEVLAEGKWPELEHLSLISTGMKLKDVETLINHSSWPNLKELRLNPSIFNHLTEESMEKIFPKMSKKWAKAKLIG